jgi:hypothetical protein
MDNQQAQVVINTRLKLVLSDSTRLPASTGFDLTLPHFFVG